MIPIIIAAQNMYVHFDLVFWSAILPVKYDESKVTVFVTVRRVFIVSEYDSSIVISPLDGIASKSAVVYSFESRSPTMTWFGPLIIIFPCFGILTVSASMSDSSMFRISSVSSSVL